LGSGAVAPAGCGAEPREEIFAIFDYFLAKIYSIHLLGWSSHVRYIVIM